MLRNVRGVVTYGYTLKGTADQYTLKKKEPEQLPDGSLFSLFTSLGNILKKEQLEYLQIDQFRINSSDASSQLNESIIKSQFFPQTLILERIFTKPKYANQALQRFKFSKQFSFLEQISFLDENMSAELCDELTESFSNQDNFPNLRGITLKQGKVMNGRD